MIYLDEEDKELVIKILKVFSPEYDVLVFGSRFNGDHKDYSDLDLVFVGDKPLSMNQRGTLQMAFSASDLPMRVDVVDYQTCSENFKKIIDMGNEKLFSRVNNE